MSNTLIIKSKLDGKDVTLELTQTEIASAVSICEQNSIEEIFVMKRPVKGGALFFTNEVAAASCQDRHNFDHSFVVKVGELKKFKPSEAPAPKADPKDAAIETLKAEVEALRDEADPKKLEDKDTEIEILKEEAVKAGNAATALTKEVEAVNKLNESQAADLKSAGEEITKLVAEIESLKKASKEQK